MPPGSAGSAAEDAAALVRIQQAVGVVARRARDGAMHESLGRRVGRPLGVPSYTTLARLQLSDGCTVTELAASLGLEVSSTSRRLQTLERQGLVRRETGATDRRVAHLWLTDEGRAVFEELQVGWRGMLAEVTATWSASEVAVFAGLFARFAADLESYAQQVAPVTRSMMRKA